MILTIYLSFKDIGLDNGLGLITQKPDDCLPTEYAKNEGMKDDIDEICRPKQKLKPIEYHTQTSGSSNSHDHKTITTQTDDQNMQRYATTQTDEACDQKNTTTQTENASKCVQNFATTQTDNAYDQNNTATQTDNSLTYSQKFATTQTDHSVFPNPRHFSASTQTTAEASNRGEHGARAQNNYLDNGGTLVRVCSDAVLTTNQSPR